MVKFRDIIQTLYPYGTFTIPCPSHIGREGVGLPVYLTFDDGPIPEVTPKVLEILARYNVKATFFMVGENIDKHHDVFRQVLEAGHAIGNHTYNHVKGVKTPFENYLRNVTKWEEAYRRNTQTAPLNYQLSTFNLFRPPYGKATFRQRRALHQRGYQLIYWDVLTRDYNPHRTPEKMFELIRRETRPGSIINFHDSLKSNERMLAVLPQAIEFLLSKGYEFKTL